VGEPVQILPLATFPPPVKSLMDSPSYYVDAKGSIIDPQRKADTERDEAPFREFGRSLVMLSDGYLRSPPPTRSWRLRPWRGSTHGPLPTPCWGR
jgi:hypothetical protein